MKHLPEQLGDWIERQDLGGWAMLLGGLVVIALVYLTPAYLINRSLETQRDVLAEQCEQITQCSERYDQFVQAWQANDALLVQRWAWHQLHLKPVGATPLDDRLPSEPGAALTPIELVGADSQLSIDSPATVAELPDTRLIRLTTGRQRYGLLGLGGGLCVAGLLMSLRPGRNTSE